MLIEVDKSPNIESLFVYYGGDAKLVAATLFSLVAEFAAGLACLT